MKFALVLFLFSVASFAEVSREEASLMIDQMVKSNIISAEEATKTKVRLQTMKASSRGRMPASVATVDPKNVDLSREQLSAIESDLKTIAPHIVEKAR